MTNIRPMRYAAGGLAGSAFIAVTQILAGATLDMPLYIALTIFAVTIPFQVFILFMPVVGTQLRSSHPAIFCIYWCVYISTTVLIPFGFVAVFWHFACWLGALFLATALTAFGLYGYCARKYLNRWGVLHAD